MSIGLSLFYGILQGATELFPVSSLGHAVVVPALLNLPVRNGDPSFVPFLVLLHLGTAAALLVIYRREWLGIVRGFVHAAVSGDVSGADERLALLLVAGTVPTGIVGVLLQKPLERLFANPRLASAFLVANAAMLLGAELLRRRAERRAGLGDRDPEAEGRTFRSVVDLGLREALLVGACQTLALLPGLSRSGATMAGGLLAGLRHEEALRFALLLATPVILGAGLVEVPSLVGVPGFGNLLAGAVVAGLVAYASAQFLVRYFRVGRLDPYAYYCAALGVAGLLLIH